MSMIGEYARVTPSELGRILQDPEWGAAFVEGMSEAEHDSPLPPEQSRCLDTDTAWDAIGFLLRRAGCAVDLVRGEEPVPGADEWGYGPPRHLTPERVAAAAEALAALPFGKLADGIGPGDLARAGVYPQILWEQAGSLEHVRACYEQLPPYFAAAARAGEAVLVWLD